VLEKVGLRHEGLSRGYVRKGDTFEDVLMYGVVREDVGWTPRLDAPGGAPC
jgi:RimJ/RimL family protein N-acetyltransferase